MIISASRRTDIPAYYSDWLMNRLHEGFAMMPNPYNANRLGRVTLSPDIVDCIAFWTKNPRPMLGKVERIADMGYLFYFMFSLLSYDKRVETNLPPKEELIDTFKELSGKIGKKRVIWRYDPIFIDAEHTVDWHCSQFQIMCEKLNGFTKRCIISFIDAYRGIDTAFRPMSEAEMRGIAKGFSAIAAKQGLHLATCAETVDLSAYGITHAACIDRQLIEDITGHMIAAQRDKNQRPACRCVESVDIGAYDTCQNGCRYCYATASIKAAKARFEKHDPCAPMITGTPLGHEIVTDRTVGSFKGL